MKKILSLAPVVAVLAACASQPMGGSATVADTLARNPEFSTLHSLVGRAGLADTLKAAGPYTVFAPTNDAFKAVPAKTMDQLARDPALLKSVLSYHVVPGKVMASQVKNGKATTAQGAAVSLSRAGDFVTVEDAMVQKADIVAANGVVHAVDRVLMPPKKK